MDSGVVVLDGVGAAMGDEPLAYCEGCRAARTIGDPGECPPGGLDLQTFLTVFVVQIDRRDLVETDGDAGGASAPPPHRIFHDLVRVNLTRVVSAQPTLLTTNTTTAIVAAMAKTNMAAGQEATPGKNAAEADDNCKHAPPESHLGGIADVFATASDRPTACATTTASGAGAPLRSQRLSVAAGGRAGFSRSGQVAAVERVSVGVVGLLAYVLAVSDGRSAGAWGSPRAVSRTGHSSVLAASDARSAGLSAAMGPPSRPAVMRCGRSSWMHMYRTVGSPSSVTQALRMCAAVDAVTAGVPARRYG